MSSIQLRALNREDFARVRALYSATKNRLRAEAYDAWCFFDTPWGDAIAVIAVDGELCVGLFVLRPTMLDLGGEDVMGALALDLMTHPDYRRRGLFVAMVEESFRLAFSRGLEVVYALPSEKRISYPGLVHRLNFDHVGDVFSWTYDIRPFRLPAPVWGSSGRPPITVGADDIRPGELEALIHAPKDERGVCRIKRDDKWLAWRYAKASGETYRWHTGRDSNGALQVAVLAGEPDDSWGGLGQGEVHLQEAFASSEDALVTVLKALTRRARRESKTSVRMLVKDAPVESALRKAGFKRTESLALTVRRLTGRTFKGNVHHAPAWRIMSGDVDMF